MKKIVTHDGNLFHADETFAIAMMELYLGEETQIVRTRDPKEFEDADYVIDVGGKYDEVKFFDHHQAQMRRDFYDPTGSHIQDVYASAGLIWQKFGDEIILKLAPSLTPEQVESLWHEIDAGVRDIDKIDADSSYTGEDAFSIGEFIGLHVLSNDPDNLLEGLREMVDFVKKFLTLTIEKVERQESDSAEVRQYIREQGYGTDVLFLPKNLRWKREVSRHPGIRFVVAPDKDGWALMTVPVSYQKWKSHKKLLPAAWVGMTGKEINESVGIDDGIFCHQRRFMAKAVSYESIQKMAQFAAGHAS